LSLPEQVRRRANTVDVINQNLVVFFCSLRCLEPSAENVALQARTSFIDCAQLSKGDRARGKLERGLFASRMIVKTAALIVGELCERALEVIVGI
jgi:hypothetical protein